MMRKQKVNIGILVKTDFEKVNELLNLIEKNGFPIIYHLTSLGKVKISPSSEYIGDVLDESE